MQNIHYYNRLKKNVAWPGLGELEDETRLITKFMISLGICLSLKSYEYQNRGLERVKIILRRYLDNTPG